MVSPIRENGQQLETVPIEVEMSDDDLAWEDGSCFTRSSTLAESERGERESQLVAGQVDCLLAVLATKGELGNEMVGWSGEESREGLVEKGW